VKELREKVLIIGCGDIGCGVGVELASKQYTIIGAKRSPDTLPDCIQAILLDVTNPSDFESLPQDINRIIYVVSADTYADESYGLAYVNGIRNTLAWMNRSLIDAKSIIFVSSTSVYHQQDGGMVDEQSLTLPQSFSGQRMLEAEQYVQQSGFSHSIVRFSGIYGPGRNRLIKQVAAGKGCVRKPVYWTNRIHRDDCIGFLVHLVERHTSNAGVDAIYIVSDSEPVPMWEIKNWLRNEMGVALTVGWSEADFSGKQNKRCVNKSMLVSGYQLKYPSYKEGYLSLVKAFKSEHVR